MNRQSVATQSISSLHVQQGLFLIFALVVTLIGGQQYQRCSQNQVALRIQHSPIIGALYHTPGTTATRVGTFSRPLIERADSQGERPAVQHWVF